MPEMPNKFAMPKFKFSGTGTFTPPKDPVEKQGPADRPIEEPKQDAQRTNGVGNPHERQQP